MLLTVRGGYTSRKPPRCRRTRTKASASVKPSAINLRSYRGFGRESSIESDPALSADTAVIEATYLDLRAHGAQSLGKALQAGDLLEIHHKSGLELFG